MREKYGTSPVGDLAVLMRAGIYFDQGKYDKAIGDYQSFLEDCDQAELRRTATEALAYAYEGLKQWDEALKTFERLADADADEDRQALVRYHKARLLGKQGKTDDAIKELEEIIKSAKSPALIERAGQQLAALSG